MELIASTSTSSTSTCTYKLLNMSTAAAAVLPVHLFEDLLPLDLAVFLLSPTTLITLLALWTVARFLHLFSVPDKPKVTFLQTGKNDVEKVLKAMPILKEKYIPPWLWGRSGHLQTAAYGLLGHATLKRTANKREYLKLQDGSTVIFDIFEPITKPIKDVTLSLTPGIANSSESNYIRTCVHYAQEAGYRCIVLNHLGALVGVPLTSARIFSYGGTDELHAMMSHAAAAWPSTRFICIGFSMGANITTKFIAEASQAIKSRIIIGLSVGQGYSATKSAPMYHDWDNSRRAYNYIITENMKRLLRRNYDWAIKTFVAKGTIDEERLMRCTSIVSFDECYSRRVCGFDTVEAFYAWCSCLPLIDKIDVPMVFFNALDDPIVPPSLWEPVQKIATSRPDTVFLTTKHGGHLGYLEGHSLGPNSVTWLDRFIVQLSDAAVEVYGDRHKI